MNSIMKELWFKWRARVYQGKVAKAGAKRLGIKAKQLVDKGKATDYAAKYNELRKV